MNKTSKNLTQTLYFSLKFYYSSNGLNPLSSNGKKSQYKFLDFTTCEMDGTITHLVRNLV